MRSKWVQSTIKLSSKYNQSKSNYNQSTKYYQSDSKYYQNKIKVQSKYNENTIKLHLFILSLSCGLSLIVIWSHFDLISKISNNGDAIT